MNEKKKIRNYSERIIYENQGIFTSLVFTSTGGIARQSQIYIRVAEIKGEKKRRKKDSSLQGCNANFFFISEASIIMS